MYGKDGSDVTAVAMETKQKMLHGLLSILSYMTSIKTEVSYFYNV